MTEFDKVIHPGGVGKVTASIHTANFKNAIAKSITVTTNDPDNLRTVLQIKANVRVPIDVQPTDMLSIDGRAGDVAPKTVTVLSTEDKAFDVISADSTDPNFTVTVKPTAAPVEAGKKAPKAPAAKAGTLASGSKSYDVTVSVGKDVMVGHPSATITLKTSHPKVAEVPIRVFANITGDVQVQPERAILQLGAQAPPQARSQHISIKEMAEGKTLAITGVESTNPQVKTTLKTVTPGKEYDLEIGYDGPPPAAPIDAHVTVKTDDPRQGVIVVPVFGRGDMVGSPMDGGHPPTFTVQPGATPVLVQPSPPGGAGASAAKPPRGSSGAKGPSKDPDAAEDAREDAHGRHGRQHHGHPPR